MVKPTHSKRKLFNGMQEHKENEPEQLTSNNLRSSTQNKHERGLSSEPGRSSEDRKLKTSGVNLYSRKETFEDVSNTHTPSRAVMPMSERQQIALLMQLSSPSPTSAPESPFASSPQTPVLSKIGKRNERGETPLHVAAIKGDSVKILQLLDDGANVNATDYAGWTALHEACNRGFAEIAYHLIEAGADVNAKGLDNDTPLHDACINNHFKIVDLLLKAGASFNSVNCRGKSPRDVCRSSQILALIEEVDAGHFNNFKLNCLPETMSRRTPPNSKTEEKPSLPVSTSGTSSTSSSISGTSVPATSNSSNNGNARPGSPRLAFRVNQMARTPEKNQPRAQEESHESEDVYEFRCSKEETHEETPADQQDEAKAEPPSSSTDKGEKRNRDAETEEDDESKKKRRKEDSKEGVKGAVRAGGRPAASAVDKGSKVPRQGATNGSNPKQGSFQSGGNATSTSVPSSTSNVSSSSSATISSVTSSVSSPLESRKSPMNTSAGSPKPAPVSKSSSNSVDSDGEDGKSESASGAPKVPPLKIVLAPASLSEQETHPQNGKNGSNRQLPYVVNSSSMEDKDSAPTDSKDAVIKTEDGSAAPSVSTPSSVASVSASSTTTTVTSTTNGNGSSSASSTAAVTNTTSTAPATSTADKPPRMTRSQKGGSGSGGSSSGEESVVVKQEIKEEPCPPSATPPVSIASPVNQQEVVQYPRKRKIRLKEPEVETPAPVVTEHQQQPLPVTNCYEMFLKMRKQVERRRRQLFPVQPKPPDGFKNYLMNRCSYALANNSNSQLSVPIIPPPTSLSQPLKDLFTEQEKERHKLKLQHQIEQTKLVLSVEQEILRVHGRAARALASQVLPFSVCTILKDEEVYNVITLEQEEKDRNLRSRYNGRHFFSWLQEVDDKWEKIKEDMVLRHHNEAESLHAVQKMDWEWKLKELNVVEANMRPSIDEIHVPMVIVSDFNLLPA